MIFASWTFDGYLLDIDVNSNEGDVTNYIKNGEWHLVKLQAMKYLRRYSCCEEPYPEIYYKLIIRRRPLFYVFNMVFPCLLITLVAFLGFYLPPGSSEKVSIGITTLLSITVFLMLVAESMPPTSEQLPLLGIYYAVTIGIVSFSTTMAVVTLNINNKGLKGQEVPRLVKIVFLQYLAKIMGANLTSHFKSSSSLLRCHNSPGRKSYQYEKRRKKTTTSEMESTTDDATVGISLVASDKVISEKKMSPEKKQVELDKVNLKAMAHQQYTSSSVRNQNEQQIMEARYVSPVQLDLSLSSRKWQKSVGRREKSLCLSPSKLKSFNECDSDSDNILIIRGTNENKPPPPPSSSDHRVHGSLSHSRSNPIYLSIENPNMDNSNRIISPEAAVNEPLLKYLRNEFMKDFGEVLGSHFNPLIKNLTNTLDKNEERQKEKQRLENIQNEWSDVAMIMDHILCYFFMIMTIIICTFIFFNSPHMLAQW